MCGSGCGPTSVPGDPSHVPSRGPVPGRSQVSAGEKHACAVRRNGELLCWGSNGAGQLGRGTAGETQPLSPALVQDVTDVVAVSAGFRHTCALRRDGSVYCWGDNENGQLGDGTRESRSGGVLVEGLHAIDVAAGKSHSCAVTEDGQVVCWGLKHQCPPGGAGSHPARSAVAGLPGKAVAVTAAATRTCALLASGGVSCWSDGCETTKPTVSDMNDAAFIEAGNTAGCAVRANGDLGCWTGVAQGIESRLVAGISRARNVSVGSRRVCALDAAGGVHCAEFLENPHLPGGRGYNPLNRQTSPPLAQLSVSSSDHHVCGMLADGRVVCFGNNSWGGLGQPSLSHAEQPVPVPGFP